MGCAREDVPSLVRSEVSDDEANQRDMRGSMGAFGEASIQDVARRVMPCSLPTIARLILAVAVRIRIEGGR